MNNQKDNNNNRRENKALSTSSPTNVSNYFNVFDHQTYVDMADRSTKIVTALYMVTDLMDENDPMRALVRENMTLVMDILFALTHAPKTERVELLSSAHNRMYAVKSYVMVMHRNGFISDMNYSVITEQIEILRTIVDAQIQKSMPYDNKSNNTKTVQEFTFSDSFFSSGARVSAPIKDKVADESVVRDTNEEEDDVKKTPLEEPVFVKRTSETSTKKSDYYGGRETKKTKPKITRAPKVNEAKEERKDNILKILKQKRDASINDICALFKDCSSKTIQRDLNDLIKDGLVRKEGSRRWSKYNLTY